MICLMKWRPSIPIVGTVPGQFLRDDVASQMGEGMQAGQEHQTSSSSSSSNLSPQDQLSNSSTFVGVTPCFSNFLHVPGTTAIIPTVETSPERRAEQQRCRLRRVGVLADIGQRLLQKSEEEAQPKMDKMVQNRQHRENIQHSMRAHNQYMAAIADAVKSASESLTNLTNFLIQNMSSDPPRPHVPMLSNVSHDMGIFEMVGEPCDQMDRPQPLNTQLETGRVVKQAMEETRHGVLWHGEEINVLLQTIGDKGYAAFLMGSLHLPNRRAYRAVVRALGNAGYRRTEAQVQTKWKAMKREFFSAVEVWGGVPRKSPWPSHYAALQQIWRLGGRPSLTDRRPHSGHRPDEAEEESDEEEVAAEAPAAVSIRECDASSSDEDGDMVAGTTAGARKMGRATPFPPPRVNEHILTGINHRLSRIEEHLSQVYRRVSVLEASLAAYGCADVATSTMVDSTHHPNSSSDSDRLMVVTDEEASTVALSPPPEVSPAVVELSSGVPANSRSSS
uniref:Uncharacterized protein n=1 Tax=Sphaerodactylus townsendi TaxID=933632 RepID=A0ACB8FHE0_9SAUR